LTASEPAASASSEVAAPAANRRRLIVLLLVAVVVVAAVIAAATALGGPGRKVETGIVVAVQATSLSNVQGFTIRTPDGRTVDFRMGRIENATQFAPGHLAEHKVSLQPVRVTYVDENGSLVAVRLEDAP
jgi:flagellar basal body-associated protein FliL